MISKTPEQRRQYDARLKWQLDENTRNNEMARLKAEFEQAFAEGEARGRAEGEVKGKAGQIHLLQDLLGAPLTSVESLQSMSLSALDEMIAELQTELRSRPK